MNKFSIMRNLILCCTFLIATVQAFSQIEVKFSPDNSKAKMCYTEDNNGIAVKETNVRFKNSSSYDDPCWYVWNFGDGSTDSLLVSRTFSTYVEHTYKTDGIYTVSLMIMDSVEIAKTIKKGKLKTAEYISSSGDSVLLSLTYLDEDLAECQANTKISFLKFGQKVAKNAIEVFSPIADGPNFTYEIDDPSSETRKAGLESFVYILSVNKNTFKPHKDDIWKYYWSIYDGPTKIKEIALDSTEYRFTFPKENVDPGYSVTLKIALDSTKFEDEQDIEYYDLTGCTASQTIKVKVSDYFFTDSTRNEKDIDDREPAIPNIFTPGGNDENDVFYFNTNGIDEFTIWIYNNNGTLVYKKVAKAISWTGDDNSGHNCPSGTYYYVIKSTSSDKRHNTAGFIQLFRQN